ncbi:glucuronyl hydrolase [Pedobacter sp. SAFR-022]|uniref:glucuronyl hydrolase n=1 Tax=Pedobacter sp. SAFR-022 TaxID=3436861 RepID=UPI003F7F4B67
MKYLFMLLAAANLISCADPKKEEKADNLDQKVEAGLKLGAIQYAYLGSRTPSGRYPKTYHEKTDSLETSDSGWWCSGFYPGTLLYLNEAAPNPELKQQANVALGGLENEQFNKSTHDLGFMMFCSFGNANRLEPKPEYDTILLNSAKSLSTRYNAKAKSIQSWDSAPWNKAGANEMPVIIDNMMNLELLFWATKFSGDSSFYKIAVDHANTTMKNHFRKDYSSFHVVIYDKNSGAVVKQITNQGAADSSAWARGQAWGLYGYVVMYRETKDKKYLQQAQHIADFLLNHPNLPEDKIPYWDFNAPNIPNALHDSSAAAIIASALFELSTLASDAKAAGYRKDAEFMLNNLLTPHYLASPKTNGGFLLMHGVGNMPNQTEVDTPLSYGDYYLVEAMLRYKKMQNR